MLFRRIGLILVVLLVGLGVVATAAQPLQKPTITWQTGPWSVNQGDLVVFKVVLKSAAGDEMGGQKITFSIGGVVVGTATTGVQYSGYEGIATLSPDYNTAPLSAGSYTVTAAFAGGDLYPYGNYYPCSKDSEPLTITVNDTTAPVITGCPANRDVNADANCCFTVPDLTVDVVATDNCDQNLDITQNPTVGTQLCGVHNSTSTVTMTVTDDASLTDTCNVTLTLKDVTAPTTVFEVTPPNPDNDPTPYFEWTGTDNCTAPANLVYRTKLDTAAWSGWSAAGADSTTLGPLTEGTHTFQVKAKDEAGNIETTATYSWVIDLSGPEITIYVPEDRGEYGLNATVPSDWVVVDLLAGLDDASASDDANTGMASGEAIYTGSVGLHEFTVTATDLAGTGNTATETVEYRVVYSVLPGGAAGGGGGLGEAGAGFLDHSIAGGGGALGITELEAIYTVGEVIHVSFSLTDADDVLMPDAIVSLTLVAVTITDGEESYTVLGIWEFAYDEDLELFMLDLPTEGLAPGIYDLWLGFDDGTQVRLRIQLDEA